MKTTRQEGSSDLANTMCGDDAALRQIALTTCYY